MKKYQSIIIFVPSVTDEIIENTLEKIKSKVEMTRIDKWGVKKMEYYVTQNSTKIRYRTGYYVCGNVKGNEEDLNQLEKELDKDENIIKYILVRTT